MAGHLAEQEISSLVIAHRLSTVQGADLILVLEAARSWSAGPTPS